MLVYLETSHKIIKYRIKEIKQENTSFDRDGDPTYAAPRHSNHNDPIR